MASANYCPVPINQIPLLEFYKLSKSWFFSWPLDSKLLYKKLIISWLLIFPFNIFICTGSFFLMNDMPRLIIICLSISLVFPLILITNQMIAWKYILKRLVSEKIVYERSGWYDGDIWENPLNWRERDLLIAQHEVKPIIQQLTNPLLINLILIFLSMTFLFLFL